MGHPTAAGAGDARQWNQFTTTRWSVVLRAGNSEGGGTEALQELCQQYWFPLYAFARRKGHSKEDAADVTQNFFAKLLATDFPAGVQKQKGKFRTFLLTSFSRFMITEWQKTQRVKRGGGAKPLSLDEMIEEKGEASYLAEAAHDETPERLFQRTWAETLLRRVFERLEAECERRGDSRFSVLRAFLLGGEDTPTLANAAQKLGLSVVAFKSLLHRFRQRYRELLFEEVGQTVDSPAELEEEMRAIIQALRS